MNHSPSDHSVQPLADPEVEHLLNDACAAPPIPRSLLKRLDGLIEQEWGTSPRLSETSLTRAGRSLSHGARWLKTLPIAAALSVAIFCSLFLLPQSATCTWADMIQALQQQTLIQVDDLIRPTTERWMSGSDGVAAVNCDSGSELVNLRDGFALSHPTAVAQIQRRRFRQSGNPSEKALLALLLNGSGERFPGGFPNDAEIADESCRPMSVDGEKRLELSVTVRIPEVKEVHLTLQVDPRTHLPLNCEVTGVTQPEHLAFRYSPATTQDVGFRIAEAFPGDLPVQDVENFVVMASSPDVSAAVTAALPGPDLSLRELQPVALVAGDVPKRPDTSEKEMPKPESSVDASSKLPEAVPPTLLDSPDRWPAVVVNARSRTQALQDLNSVMNQLWQQHQVEPVQPASDEELLRRIYLDLAGRTPGVVEVRQYLADSSTDRYERLVDRLLASSDHASHLAASFRTFLIPEGVDLTSFGGVEAFDKWLAGEFQKNEPYDRIARSLLLAEGRLSHSGPLLFYSAAMLNADQLAARTARVFLGMRLECAQCHDHPFEAWTQKDFWGFAAFFARISRPRGTLESASTVMQVRDVDHGEVTLPDSKVAVAPKFLGTDDELTEIAPDARRKLLADWLTSAENPYFARATANRVWGQMFGRGIVDPMDDLGMQHPPRSPELLDLLAGWLIQSDFRLQELFRVVALSDAYRLSSGAPTDDDERVDCFAQMNVKTLTAEQVYDCISVATMLTPETDGNAYSLAVNRFGNGAREQFLQQFRTPAGRPTEYQGGIPQALTLMNGTLIDSATGLSSSGLLSSLEAPFFSNRQRIEVLYFSTLSRQPTASESELLQSFLPDNASGEVLRESLSDILWALLNSAEFTVNH
ncbi:MAG: DUF1549 and DUF1553 domain-containing protein [Planctomycetaceae bacterium]